MDRQGSGGAQAFLERRIAEGGGEANGGRPNGEAQQEASALGALLDGVGGMFEVSLDRIRRDPAQPRREFDERELNELAANLRQLGQLQPAVVRPAPDEPGCYLLVMGERRWRAAAIASLPTLQCILRHEDVRLIPAKQWAENHFRADLSPLEEAGAIKSVMELEKLDVPGFAARYHLSERTVRRYLQLLAAPVWIQSAVMKGEQVKVGDATEVRKLDLTGAVELQRIFNTYLRQEEAAAEPKDPSDRKAVARALTTAAKKAQQRAESVKRRALRDNWSRRRWQGFAAEASGGRSENSEVPAKPKPLFEVLGSRLVIHLDSIPTAGAEDLQALLDKVSGILAAARDAVAGASGLDEGVSKRRIERRF